VGDGGADPLAGQRREPRSGAHSVGRLRLEQNEAGLFSGNEDRPAVSDRAPAAGQLFGAGTRALAVIRRSVRIGPRNLELEKVFRHRGSPYARRGGGTITETPKL
jgi:hypothetical protein